MRSYAKPFLAVPVLMALAAAQVHAQEVDPALYEETVSQAIEYLTTQGQADDGSYSSYAGPGLTALAVTGILENGRSPDDPAVAKSLEYLEEFVQDDGGIYGPGSRFPNYETCICVMCLAAANEDGRYDDTLAKAEEYLKGNQRGAEGDIGPDDVAYGGAGYGGEGRPDLSNTAYLIEALQAAGADADDEAMQRALVFVSRCQNLESEHNDTQFASANPDGGFYYTPAGGGDSEAGEVGQGGLRSYGSMTYSGLKSMVYAGVDEDDPRVQAAYAWIQNNYSVEGNPGVQPSDAGLYYYYNTFAKALEAMNVDTVTDTDGVEHDWRGDLVAHLASIQNDDGSWVNSNERWLEGDPNLATGFALLALARCQPPEEE